MRLVKLTLLFVFAMMMVTASVGFVSADAVVTVGSVNNALIGEKVVIPVYVNTTGSDPVGAYEVHVDLNITSANYVTNITSVPDCEINNPDEGIIVDFSSAVLSGPKELMFEIDVTPLVSGIIPVNLSYVLLEGNGAIPCNVVNGTVTVPAVTHTITASAGANGMIDPSGAVSVEDGKNQTFNITANQGYKIASFLVDGETEAPLTYNFTNYTFTNVVEDHTIDVTFVAVPKPEFTITATAGANGSISPSGNVLVPQGEDKTFTIRAAPGYEISDITVNGTEVEISSYNISSYTFTNVIANGNTISANFTAEPPIIIVNITNSSNPTVGVPVIFTADVISENDRYETSTITWTFDDKTEATGVAKKTFAEAGTYNVTVSAKSNNGLTNSTKFSLTVNEAKKEQTNPTRSNVTNTSSAIIPDVEIPVITFDASDVNASLDLNVTIDKYVKDATEIDTEMSGKTVPNSAAILLYMNVSTVEGVNNSHSLDSYANVILNITLGSYTAENISFFRFADGDTLGEALNSRILEKGTGWAKYEIEVPGFSAIVASVNEVTPVTPVEPVTPVDPVTPAPKTPGYYTGGGSSPKTVKTTTPVQAPVQTQAPSTPVQTQTQTQVPLATPTQAVPTQTSSPAPFIGIIAALGAAALVLRRK